MKIEQYYIISYYEDDRKDFAICTEFSITKDSIIVYNGNGKELVLKHNSSRIKIEHVTIIDGKKISDENYIYFN